MKISFALAAIQWLAASAVLVGCSSNTLLQPLNPPTRTWNNTWHQATDANANRLKPTNNTPRVTMQITPTTFGMVAPELEFSYPPPLMTLTKQRTVYGFDLGRCTSVSANKVIAPAYTWIRVEINAWLDTDRRCLAQIFNALRSQSLKLVLAIQLPQITADSLDGMNQLRQFGAALADLLQKHVGQISAVELRANSNASLEYLTNSLSLAYGVVKRLNPNIWMTFDVRRTTAKETWLTTATSAQLAPLWRYVDCLGLQIDHEALHNLDQRLEAARYISANKPICVTVIWPIEQAKTHAAWRGVPLLLVLRTKTS